LHLRNRRDEARFPNATLRAQAPTHAPRQNGVLFDHLVGDIEHVGGTVGSWAIKQLGYRAAI
jgi:hypothetical protein